MIVRAVAYGSPEYDGTVELRREVLRRPLGLDFTPEQLASEAEDVHLAFYEGEVLLACLVLTPGTEKTVKMRQVAVRADVQGKGVGRALVEASEREAIERGYARIVLHARENAVPFYECLRYATEGESFIEIGLPHRAMAKTLV